MKILESIVNLGDIQSINSESIQDSKLKNIYNELLEQSNLDEISISENTVYIDSLMKDYNSRVEFLNLNEKYNSNFQIYINDTITLTENLVNQYDRKTNKHALTPSRFKENLTSTESDKLIGSLHFSKWLRSYIVRSLRVNLSKEIIENELKRIFGNIIFLNKVQNLFEADFLKVSKSLKKSKNTIHSQLSFLFQNSLLIDFEKLFPRAGSTARATYQALVHIAESNGKKTITGESFKTITLKCRTNVTDKTTKNILIKADQVGMIKLEIKNRIENEKAKIELTKQLKEGKLTVDDYTKKLKNELKQEFLESITLLDLKKSKFFTLKKKIETKFFKSELLNVKSLGKRGSELFWLIFDRGSISKSDIYNSYPELKNKTDSLREKLNVLEKLDFVICEKKIYRVNTQDFLLKIERAKELDIVNAKARAYKSNTIFNNAKQKLIDNAGELNNPILNSFDDNNVKNLIHRNKKLLQYIGKKWKNGTTKQEIKTKAKMSTVDILISQLTTVTILIYENGRYKLNKELYDYHTKKQRKIKIPHLHKFNHFLAKQVNQFEDDRTRYQAFIESLKEKDNDTEENENVIRYETGLESIPDDDDLDNVMNF